MSQIANQNIVVEHPKTPVVRLRLKKLPRALRIAVTATSIVAATILAIWAFESYEYSPWTRDGRISAYVVDTAPEISGLVIDVPVQDNQFVHKGDLLYKIDARDYQAILKRSQAAVDAANAKLTLEHGNEIAHPARGRRSWGLRLWRPTTPR